MVFGTVVMRGDGWRITDWGEGEVSLLIEKARYNGSNGNLAVRLPEMLIALLRAAHEDGWATAREDVSDILEALNKP